MATQVNRLVGNFAVCRVASSPDATTGNLVAHLLEWEVTITTTFADATAHGDSWDVPVILKQEWTGRCRGFMTEASRISFLSLWNAGGTGGPPASGPYGDPPAITLIGHNDYLTLGADDSKVLFRGTGYATTATIRLPQGMSDQEIQFRGIGSPLFIGA